MGLPLMRPRSVELGCLRTRTVAVVQSASLLLPVLALGCGPRPEAETSDAPLVMSAPVEHLAAVAVREPMVVEHPEGTLFVAGFSQAMEESGRPPELFKSTDGGSSWEAVPVGTVAEEAVGNSDVDLAIAVEPSESPVLSGGAPGAHRIEGVGPGFIPPMWRADLADEILRVSTEEAKAMARRLAREEPLFAGTSSGANVVAGTRVAQRLGPGRTLATLLCDSGLKFLSTDLYSSS